MENDYFLVTWIQEDPVRFSVMARADITEESVRKLSCDKLINQEISFKWNKKISNCIGKILDSGN